MDIFIDRRQDGKNKGVVNRQKFIRRFKGQIKKAVMDSLNSQGITDVNDSEKVNIPARDVAEPTFGHDPKKGIREVIHPGNREFVKGDRISRPPGGGGSGGSGSGQASNSGEGADDFVFAISREEYLNIFFDELELPNMVRKQLAVMMEFKPMRAGFTSHGSPNMIAIVPTFKRALGRKLAIQGARNKKVQSLEEKIRQLLENGIDFDDDEIVRTREEIERMRARKPPLFIEPLHDLRFRNLVMIPRPSIRAVVFFLMDVSGSMGAKEKDLAKRFFLLLFLFLRKHYEKVEIVFIRHHTTAKEVDEEEFFYGKENGGTVVSTALELMVDIQQKRFPASGWNIYGAQASDGDDWGYDVPKCRDILLEKIMPFCQHFSYLETVPVRHQDLWEMYEGIATKYARNFAMQVVREPGDVYPAFCEIFKKRTH